MKIEVRCCYEWNGWFHERFKNSLSLETEAENLFPRDIELIALGLLCECPAWIDERYSWSKADIFVDGELFDSIVTGSLGERWSTIRDIV